MAANVAGDSSGGGAGSGAGEEDPVTLPPGGNDTTTAITFLATGLDNMAARASVLALFIIVGFVGNCVLVATIAQSHRLKVFKLNLFILSIAIVNLINCIVNMPLILGNAITEVWDYGDFVCRFNAFTLQLASIAMILGLLLMTLDRFLALRFHDHETYTTKMTPMRANLLIVYSWLHAFGFSVPLLLGFIPVKAFPARYLCAIDTGANTIYLALTSLCCYLLPVLVILGFFIYIIKTGVQERMRRQLHQNAYSEREYNPHLQTEINTAKFVGIVVILWCVCEGPYLTLTAIEQYKNSGIVQNSGLDIDFEYPWQVDLSFTWLKLSYAIVMPILTLFWRKEVWQKFKNCVLCRKSNLVVDASPKRKARKAEPPKRPAVPEANKVEMNSNGSFTVPVLFATPEGLHVQTYSKKDGDSDKELCSDKGIDSPTTDSSVIATKCDVYGSQNFLDLEEGDTSDYDSEIDPFSVSNPISVHTKGSFENQRETVIDLKETEPEKDEIKFDDSGLAFNTISNTNSKERDKGPKKKKKEKVQDDDQGIMMDDRNDQDSGRGSYGENSLRKKKRQKQPREDAFSNPPFEPNSPASPPSPQIPDEPIPTEAPTHEIPPTGPVTKKKKKKGKKNKAVVETKPDPEVTVEPERKPIPAMRRPAPARLNPIQNNDEYLDKISIASGQEGSEFMLKRHRPLPELPDKKVQRQVSEQPRSNPGVDVPEKKTHRQCSEQPRSNVDTPPSVKKSNSESCLASVTETPMPTPTPAPRKSRIKSLAQEEEEASQDGSMKRLKRKERKRTSSQSTNDSQTMLLQNSNTSTDLSDLHELNKVVGKLPELHKVVGKSQEQSKAVGKPQDVTKIAGKQEVYSASQLPPTKTKKSKKKVATEAKKSESKQDLLDSPRL